MVCEDRELRQYIDMKSTLCGKELYSEVGLLGFITTVIQSCLRLAIGAKIRAKNHILNRTTYVHEH